MLEVDAVSEEGWRETQDVNQSVQTNKPHAFTLPHHLVSDRMYEMGKASKGPRFPGIIPRKVCRD
ncbi:hypothetical protein BC938DRAFT_479924 [Jimgerdemannia flammicorona]|uniref:Uncharacterized protein n=1 Tax=Jimgerdemannia flammicorona TaxID=994334 RepID=A0A433QJS8_9FUNG|nr:hypothetical protein BC938DRAFT_479924 [Jimgerdemannia flammicorona]